MCSKLHVLCQHTNNQFELRTVTAQKKAAENVLVVKALG